MRIERKVAGHVVPDEVESTLVLVEKRVLTRVWVRRVGWAREDRRESCDCVGATPVRREGNANGLNVIMAEPCIEGKEERPVVVVEEPWGGVCVGTVEERRVLLVGHIDSHEGPRAFNGGGIPECEAASIVEGGWATAVAIGSRLGFYSDVQRE